MKRQRHIIKPVTRACIPSRYICVSYESHDANTYNGESPVRFQELDNITHISYVIKHGGKIFPDQYIRWHNPSLLLDDILKMTKGGNTCMIITLGLRQLMDTARLWDWFNDGTLSLGTNPIDTPVLDKKGKRIKWTGCCILGDPPNIIEARVMPTGGRIRMIDMRNYGIKCYDKGTVDAWKCKFVLDWSVWYYKQLIENDMGSWCNTGASQGWHTWRRKAMTHKMFVHDCYDAIALERAAYYGGRTECKVLGTVGEYMHTANKSRVVQREPTTVHQLDVVGSYLGIAKDLSVPIAIIGPCNSLDSIYSSLTNQMYAAIADVDIFTDSPNYPVRWTRKNEQEIPEIIYGENVLDGRHPLSKIKEGEVIYPIGRFRTTLCGNELRLAIEENAITRIHNGYIYHAAKALAKWAEYCWPPYLEARKSLRDHYKATWKSISLGALGKFAAWFHNWVHLTDHDPRSRWDWWYYMCPDKKKIMPRRTLDGVTSQYEGMIEGRQTMPAVGAYITAEGRVKLLEIMHYAGNEEVFYYATDSVWVSDKGYSRLCNVPGLCGNGLGQLRLVDSYQWVRFCGIGHYITPKEIVRAGFPRCEYIEDSSRVDTSPSPDLKTELAYRQPPRPVIVTVPESVPAPYRHGQVNSNYEVKPWVLKQV